MRFIVWLDVLKGQFAVRSIYFLATPSPSSFVYTYPVAPITDYEEQIQGTNSIRDTVISATRRTVCYNQSIYDDMLLETSEYIGLTLAVRDATIPTEVEPMYDHAAIMILDDESKL